MSINVPISSVRCENHTHRPHSSGFTSQALHPTPSPRNHKRLLHPGADARLILPQYVATIKCVRIIDPPGVFLFKVVDPIRRYLRFYSFASPGDFFTVFSFFLVHRERPDTIRSIVANLVGDGESGDSLVDENEPIQPPQ